MRLFGLGLGDLIDGSHKNNREVDHTGWTFLGRVKLVLVETKRKERWVGFPQKPGRCSWQPTLTEYRDLFSSRAVVD